jgi:hypothetical protein
MMYCTPYITLSTYQQLVYCYVKVSANEMIHHDACDRCLKHGMTEYQSKLVCRCVFVVVVLVRI